MTQSIFDNIGRGSHDDEPSRREAERRAQAARAEDAREEEKRAEEQRERAELAARDAERDTVAEREQMQRDAERRERGNQPEAAPQSFGTTFLAEGKTEAAWERWRELQSTFVDDPQSSVEQAHGLVGEVIDDIVCRFETEREQLEKRWSSGQEVSTEDLRRCLQRYRDFFGRLLANVEQTRAE